MKKITSMFLALVMALALAVPAFASNNTVKVESSIQLPTINVVMPTTAAIVMNPYKMTVTVDAKNNVTSSDQIVSQEMYVKNMSNLDLLVGVQIQGTHGRGDAKFATGTTTSSSVKEAFIYAVLKVGIPNAKIADPGYSASTTGIALLSEGATAGTDETLKDVTGFPTTGSIAVTYGTNVLRGMKYNATTDKQDVHPTEGTLGIKFFGDISPVTTWTDKDTLAATMAFTFTPVPNDPATLTLDNNTLALDSTSTTTGTVEATFDAGNTEATVATWAWESDDTNVATVSGVTTAGPETVTYVGDGSANITVTATLDDGTVLTATCVVTCTT